MFAHSNLPHNTVNSIFWRVEKFDLSERIMLIIRHFGINKNIFSKKIGISPATFSGYINDGREPGYTFIGKIVKKYPEINSEWLLTGEGEMLRKDQDVIDAQKQYKMDVLEDKVKMLQEQVGLYQRLVTGEEKIVEMISESNKIHQQQVERVRKATPPSNITQWVTQAIEEKLNSKQNGST